uniref:histidine kinase n=1 Tax=uncultured Thiotrichaceae bacterium TaxID=298394 RepID=A0A6S6TVV5_9GAMM
MIRRLLNTTVFRLSLVYALLFSLVAAIAMVSVYWVVERHIMHQTDAQLQLQADVLLNRYGFSDSDSLFRDILRRNQRLENSTDKRFYYYKLFSHRGSDSEIIQNFEAEYTTNDPRNGHQLFATQPLNETINFSLLQGQHQPARILIRHLPNSYQLLVATDMTEQEALLDKVSSSMWLAIAGIVTLALLSGGLMGYGVLRRIDSVRQTAGEIINGDLSQRMSVKGRNDEFDRLSIVLNSMLQRIEQLMLAMREVTDNLAHDLRNPLNRLRNRLEANQFRDPESTDFQQLNQDAMQDVDDLIKTFNALLSIAQVESGVQRDGWTDVDMTHLINDLAELYDAVAEEKQISFTHQCEDNLVLHGNLQLLAQALTNLLDNAVKYTPEQGNITLEAKQTTEGLQIIVADSGIGIPADKRDQVFERFVRLEEARSSPGNGLGLSLVKAVTDLHDATIQLEDNENGLKVLILFNVPLVRKKHTT